MPQRDYRAYAMSPKGKEARAKAHARYIAKRRESNAAERAAQLATNPQPLIEAWSNHDQCHPV